MPCEHVQEFDSWGVCVYFVDLDNIVLYRSVSAWSDSVVTCNYHNVMWVFVANPNRADGREVGSSHLLACPTGVHDTRKARADRHPLLVVGVMPLVMTCLLAWW